MIFFWSIIIIMIVISLIFVLYPLLNKADHQLTDPSEYNLQLHQNRLNELSGQTVHAGIEQRYYQTIYQELNRQLLDDRPDLPMRSIIQSRRSIWAASLLVLIIPGVALLLYDNWGDSKQLQQLLITQQNIAQEQQMRAQLGSPQQVILQLKEHLQNDPGSAQGWYLLGRLYASQQQFNDANVAFAKANQLSPHNGDILFNYAESLLMQNNDQITTLAARLLKELLILQPDNDVARNLLAIGAYQRKDYQSAIKNWEMILPHLSANSMDQQELLQAIAKAQTALANKKPPL